MRNVVDGKRSILVQLREQTRRYDSKKKNYTREDHKSRFP